MPLLLLRLLLLVLILLLLVCHYFCDGDGYVLTHKVPTWRHHCLAHVLSDDNAPTIAGNAEVWGGPLSGGDYVVGLLNRGKERRELHADFTAFEIPGLGQTSSFLVTDLWQQTTLGKATGAVNASVPPHDMVLYRLRGHQSASERK